MSEQKQHILTEKEYQKIIKDKDRNALWFTAFRPFSWGFYLCLVKQKRHLHIFLQFHRKALAIPHQAFNFHIGTLTSLGIYDHIAQWAGAGTAIPVTGLQIRWHPLP